MQYSPRDISIDVAPNPVLVVVEEVPIANGVAVVDTSTIVIFCFSIFVLENLLDYDSSCS